MKEDGCKKEEEVMKGKKGNEERIKGIWIWGIRDYIYSSSSKIEGVAGSSKWSVGTG